jgi:hypothetical protein
MQSEIQDIETPSLMDFQLNPVLHTFNHLVLRIMLTLMERLFSKKKKTRTIVVAFNVFDLLNVLDQIINTSSRPQKMLNSHHVVSAVTSNI